MNTLILAHYYTTPEVQAMADYVGDSLDLAMHAAREKPDRIVFAGVRFMAETAKIINPETEVILPDWNSTCSLVEMTEIDALKEWLDAERGPNVRHVSYINSSAEHKALADYVVTSRNVQDVVQTLIDKGFEVLYSPDRNMGMYLNHIMGWNVKTWHAVCEVHDAFKVEELEREWKKWTDYPKYLIAHPESPLPVLKRADYVGSTHGMLNWVKEFPYPGGTIYVATEDGLLYNMRQLRPELDFRQAPTYTGCQCHVCPYMKLNTVKKVEAAMRGEGRKIDYLTDETMNLARIPIERMLRYQKIGILDV